MVSMFPTGNESINNYSFMIENVLVSSTDKGSIEISSEEWHKIYNEVTSIMSSKTLKNN